MGQRLRSRLRAAGGVLRYELGARATSSRKAASLRRTMFGSSAARLGGVWQEVVHDGMGGPKEHLLERLVGYRTRLLLRSLLSVARM